jgi:hypothetical protein
MGSRKARDFMYFHFQFYIIPLMMTPQLGRNWLHCDTINNLFLLCSTDFFCIYFVERLIFCDEAIFHISGKVNRHNVHICGTEQPHAQIEHQCDSPKLNVFCAVSREKVYGPFFFAEATVTGIYIVTF